MIKLKEQEAKDILILIDTHLSIFQKGISFNRRIKKIQKKLKESLVKKPKRR